MSPTTEASIREVLERVAAPLVERDGGVLRIVSIDDERVVVALEAACVGCPARPITRDGVLAALIEAELGRAIVVELA